MNNPLTERFLSTQYTESDIDILINGVKEGNIPSMLRVVLHNQSVLNKKLDALLEIAYNDLTK